MDSVKRKLAAVQAEADPNRRNLLVAEIVTELFRAAGTDPIVVGGSAVEFYSDGTYVSGDVDICFSGARLPTPRERESILAPVGTPVGTRSWRVAEVVVDLLGQVETAARTPFQRLGELKLIQIEDLIAERILVAHVPQPDAARRQVAKLLVALALKGAVECDFAELERVASLEAYRVGTELCELVAEVRRETASSETR